MNSDDDILNPAAGGSGAARDSAAVENGKNPAAQALGQRGGLRRAAVIPPERRSEIAREAALRRWEKRRGA